MLMMSLIALAMVATQGQPAGASPPPPVLSPMPPASSSPPILRSGSITDADYPSMALRAEAQGSTRVRLHVSADGRVTDCVVIKASGTAQLDSTTCNLARRRFRYIPARLDGRPVPGATTYSVAWVIPEEPVIQFALGRFELNVVASPGAIESCMTALSGIAFAERFARACEAGDWSRLIDARELGNHRRVSARQIVTLVPAGERDVLARLPAGPIWEQIADLEISPEGRVLICQTISERGAYPGYVYLRLNPICDELDFRTPFPEVAGRALRRARIQSVVYVEIDP